MQLYELVTYIVIALIIVIFIAFPEARSLGKGFIRLFIKDMATTPEGAEAIYEEKINKARESYNKADDAYKMNYGRLTNEEKKLQKLQDNLKKVESQCETLVKAGKMEAASLKAEEREEIVSDIQRTETIILALKDATQTAKEALELCEKNLRKIKKESKDVVSNMRTKEQMKEIYDELDDLKSSTGTDKLLESIREKNENLDAIVSGSKAAHDAKLSTRLSKAEQEAKSLQSNDYLESLKKKYNK